MRPRRPTWRRRDGTGCVRGPEDWVGRVGSHREAPRPSGARRTRWGCSPPGGTRALVPTGASPRGSHRSPRRGRPQRRRTRAPARSLGSVGSRCDSRHWRFPFLCRHANRSPSTLELSPRSATTDARRCSRAVRPRTGSPQREAMARSRRPATPRERRRRSRRPARSGSSPARRRRGRHRP